MSHRHSILVTLLAAHGLLACSDAGVDSSQGRLTEGAAPSSEDSHGARPRGAGAGEVSTPPQPSDAEASMEPRAVSGNPSSCAAVIPEAAGTATFKVDPAKSGTYTSPDGELTVNVVATEKTFSFTSNVPLSWVVVKGGNGANIYSFEPPVAEATGLVAPQNKGLSHLDFCYGGSPPGGGGGAGGTGASGGSGGTSTGGTGAGGAGGTGTGAGGGFGSGAGVCPSDQQIYYGPDGVGVCTPLPSGGACPSGYGLETIIGWDYCVPAL